MSEDPEVRFRRQLLVRRVIFGVGAITFGIASIVGGIALFVAEFRMLRVTMVSLLIGALLVARGVFTLRRGPVGHSLAVDAASEQEPVPTRMIAVATAVVVLTLLALVAWPTGVYRWIGTLDSGCRALITPAELSEILGTPISLTHVSDSSGDMHCNATFSDATGPVATVEIGGDLAGHQFNNELDFVAKGSKREPIDGLGDLAFRIPNDRNVTLIFKHAHAGAIIQLPTSASDRAITVLAHRMNVLDPYSARWISRYGDH